MLNDGGLDVVTFCATDAGRGREDEGRREKGNERDFMVRRGCNGVGSGRVYLANHTDAANQERANHQDLSATHRQGDERADARRRRRAVGDRETDKLNARVIRKVDAPAPGAGWE
jgi:hypothetical protein